MYGRVIKGMHARKGKNMHLWQEKQAWDTTLLGKKEMHGAQSPQEQPLKGMRVLNGGKHACQGAKLCMHACMYEDKAHKGHGHVKRGLG